MKKLPLILSVLAITLTIGHWAYNVLYVTKLAYIDSSQLLDGYQGMVDARAAYEKKSVAWKANIDTLQQEVTRKIMDYEQEAVNMTEREKQLSQELIRSKQQEFRQYQQAIQQQAEQEDATMTRQVLDQVNAFIKAYGDEHGYEVILGTGQGNIAYAKDGLNITAEVLAALNYEYRGK